MEALKNRIIRAIRELNTIEAEIRLRGLPDEADEVGDLTVDLMWVWHMLDELEL